MSASSERYIGGGSRKEAPVYEGHEASRGREYKASPEADKRELDLARKTAHKEASEVFGQESRDTEDVTGRDTASPRASKVGLKKSFSKTMAEVRKQMPIHQKIFSNVIHNPVIEKVSDVASTTIARPNAILSGSIGALVITGALYLLARYYGFSLSGSETIIAFAAGWALGIIFDIIKRLVSAKR